MSRKRVAAVSALLAVGISTKSTNTRSIETANCLLVSARGLARCAAERNSTIPAMMAGSPVLRRCDAGVDTGSVPYIDRCAGPHLLGGSDAHLRDCIRRDGAVRGILPSGGLAAGNRGHLCRRRVPRPVLASPAGLGLRSGGGSGGIFHRTQGRQSALQPS